MTALGTRRMRHWKGQLLACLLLALVALGAAPVAAATTTTTIGDAASCATAGGSMDGSLCILPAYTVAAGDTLTIGSIVVITEGAFSVASGGTVNVNGFRLRLSGGATNAGTITIHSGGFFSVTSATTNGATGTIVVAGTMSLTGTLTNDGTITVPCGGSITNGGSIVGNPPQYADCTAPTAHPTPSPAANGAGWNNADVTVAWNWTDNPGGSGIDAVNCTTSSMSSGEGSAIRLSASCTDLAGNTGNADYTVKVDKTAPTVTYSAHPATYTVDQPVSITCTASDNLSGVATTTCAGISGPAYTFGLGPHAYSATATDNAGNAMSASMSTGFTVIANATAIDAVIAKLVTNPSVAATLQQQANAIASAPNATAKANKLNAFSNAVNAQTGKSITQANATILINLAKAL
jgi:hypothetical protein